MRRRDVVAAASAALALPRIVWGQGKRPLVGVLVLGNPPPDLLLQIFRDALRKRGYIEDRDIAYAVRSAGGSAERLPELASELVRIGADVIVTWQTPATAAAKAVTRTIPIVMAGAADPVGNGFIASHARPGGNITGISGAGGEVYGKGVELLREVLPRARRFAVLANAADPFTTAFVRLVTASAQAAGVQLLVSRVRLSDDLRAVFSLFAKSQVDGLIVQPSLVGPAVAELALSHRLPSMSGFRGFADNGGLMSYAFNQVENFEQAARYVDLILKGAKPADLPAANATKFELVINLRTAKALGISIPQTLLIRADDLIE